MTRLVLSELFGPTIQGEGPYCGRRATFVRFGLCNLDCRNCDTAYTWDWTGRTGTIYVKADELAATTVADVATEVLEQHTDLVVITGGEPLVQTNAVVGLAKLLGAAGRTVQVETNGTIDPANRNDDDAVLDSITWVVSPKMAAMPTSTGGAVRLDVLERFADRPDAHLKVVCATPTDVADAATLAAVLGWPLSKVWVMPEGIDAATITQRTEVLADAAIAHGLNLTTRLHVLAWGLARRH
jgi:organic radical activating enzyme